MSDPTQKVLDELLRSLRQPKEEHAAGNGGATSLEDKEVLERLFDERQGEKWRDLYKGEWGKHYNSQSEADGAFLRKLAFWTNGNAEQMERIARSSGLAREKWDTRRGGATWLEHEIERAIEATPNGYKQRSKKSSANPQSDGSESASRFQKFNLATALEQGLEPEELLVPDVLYAPTSAGDKPEGRVHMIYAKGGTGKTFLALWLMKRVILAEQPVVFLDQENGVHTIVDRLKDLGVKHEMIAEYVHYYPFPSAPVDDEALAEFGQILEEIQPALVIFDSWINFLAAAGMDENSSNDVALWSEAYAQKARKAGASVLLLDHVPKDGKNGARGSGRKRDYVDVMWELLNPQTFDRQSMGRIELRKQKDRQGWMPAGVAFSVGTPESGGFVFRPTPFDTSMSAPDGLLPSDRTALDALKSFGATGARDKEWREETMKRGKSRATYYTSKKTLIRLDLVNESDGRFSYKTPANERSDKVQSESNQTNQTTPNGGRSSRSDDSKRQTTRPTEAGSQRVHNEEHAFGPELTDDEVDATALETLHRVCSDAVRGRAKGDFWREEAERRGLSHNEWWDAKKRLVLSDKVTHVRGRYYPTGEGGDSLLDEFVPEYLEYQAQCLLGLLEELYAEKFGKGVTYSEWKDATPDDPEIDPELVEALIRELTRVGLVEHDDTDGTFRPNAPITEWVTA